jgi:ABC-2 type transport system ATP-binding protein
MPEDAHPVEPDGGSRGARGSGSPVRSLPPKPDTPAEVAAAQKAREDAAPRPTSTRSPRKSPRGKVVADPGPPPPLPSDLVIPPKPPLPPVVVEPEVVAVEPELIEPELELELVEPEPELELVEPEPDLVEPEPQPVLPPESEPGVEAETVRSAPAVESDLEPVTVAEAVHVEPEAVAPVSAIEQPAPAPLRHTVAPIAAALPEALVAASVGTGATALVVKGVTKAFGDTRAVDGIDLTVPAGIFYGLVGPNGAGKTTTLSMIAGLLRPDRGSIRVNGVDAASDPLGAKRQMGVLPDRLRTFDRLTGRQLLHYYGVLRGLPSAVVESRTADLARAFDLSDSLGRVVSDYSAGMVKKVMLAGAMIHSPRLLVLDEPFESVDPVSSAIILDILRTYVAHGGTVILSSHGMDLVQRVCTRVAVIVAGQVLAEGTVDEVRGELTLEQRFIELAGGLSDVEGLEWLHTFSD